MQLKKFLLLEVATTNGGWGFEHNFERKAHSDLLYINNYLMCSFHLEKTM